MGQQEDEKRVPQCPLGKSKAKPACHARLMPSLTQIANPSSPGEAPGSDHILQGHSLSVEPGQEQFLPALHDVTSRCLKGILGSVSDMLVMSVALVLTFLMS